MKDKLAKLIDLKTIVTLIFTIVTSYLAIVGKVEAKEFLSLTSMILIFYFGVQKQKKDSE